MLTDTQIQALDAAWSSARADGALGRATVEELYDHAAGFVPAASVVLGGYSDASAGSHVTGLECVDVGTGAGVPGVLLALQLPTSRWRLIDASERRCGFARRAVRALGLGDRIEVIHGRVDQLARTPQWRGSADLVTARLFGAPAEVAECALPLLAPGGHLVVSASPSTTAVWRGADLAVLGAELAATWDAPSTGGVASSFVALRLRDGVDESFPRRPAKRRRTPLF